MDPARGRQESPVRTGWLRPSEAQPVPPPSAGPSLCGRPRIVALRRDTASVPSRLTRRLTSTRHEREFRQPSLLFLLFRLATRIVVHIRRGLVQGILLAQLPPEKIVRVLSRVSALIGERRQPVPEGERSF